MGQRHMTYVIVDDGYGTSIRCIYNQWNTIDHQAIKLHRAVKLFETCEPYDIFGTYFATQGLSPECGWVGGYDNTDEYRQRTESFLSEDNNNGWNIIKLIKDGRKVKVELCLLLGDEDCREGERDGAICYDPLDYFMRDSPQNDIIEYRSMVNYIIDNVTYNTKLESEARVLLSKLGKR